MQARDHINELAYNEIRVGARRNKRLAAYRSGPNSRPSEHVHNPLLVGKPFTVPQQQTARRLVARLGPNVYISSRRRAKSGECSTRVPKPF